MPSASYTDFQFSHRSSCFVRILVTASAAALFGVAAGGASVFAIVTALEPASAPQSVPESGPAEPINPVVAKVAKPAPTGPGRDDVSTAPDAAPTTPLTEANTEASPKAPRPLSGAPSGAEVQPWPGALTRPHRTAPIATAKSDQRGPTPPRPPSTLNQTAPLPRGSDEAAEDNKVVALRTVDRLKTIHSNLPARPTITPLRQRAAEVAPPAQRLASEEASGVSQDSLRGLFNLFTGDQVLTNRSGSHRGTAANSSVTSAKPTDWRKGARDAAWQIQNHGALTRTRRERRDFAARIFHEAIQADEPRVRPDDGLFGLFGAGRNTWDRERND